MSTIELASSIANALGIEALEGPDPWIALGRQIRSRRLLLILDALEEVPADAEVLTEDDLLAEGEDAPPVESPYDRPGKWFVVHTQSGYEKKVKQNLEARTSSMNMEERIHEVVIPMEDVVEFKNGKKVVVQKKVFPGYLLVRQDLDDDSWYVVRNTPGVTIQFTPGAPHLDGRQYAPDGAENHRMRGFFVIPYDRPNPALPPT